MTFDRYREFTVYQGRPGLLELQFKPVATRGRGASFWRWRFVGCSRFWRESPSKIMALTHAAWSCGFGGEQAQWFPIEARTR